MDSFFNYFILFLIQFIDRLNSLETSSAFLRTEGINPAISATLTPKDESVTPGVNLYKNLTLFYLHFF